MKIIGIFFVLVASLGLLACAQRQYQPSATEIKRDTTMAGIRNSLDRIGQCADGLRMDTSRLGDNTDLTILSATKLVDSQVLYYTDASTNKVELMSSAAKIAPIQRQALLTYLAANQKCRQLSRSELSQYPSFLLVYENYYGDTDILYAKLISKEITIGEANRQKSALLAKAKTEFTLASEKINNQFNAAINQEVQTAQAQDAQRRAIAAQYLMNQQNINAQQQMNNKPINTTCNRWGNQVNCTTQ